LELKDELVRMVRIIQGSNYNTNVIVDQLAAAYKLGAKHENERCIKVIENSKREELRSFTYSLLRMWR
jgi:hypothetical protein